MKYAMWSIGGLLTALGLLRMTASGPIGEEQAWQLTSFAVFVCGLVLAGLGSVINSIGRRGPAR